MMNVNQDVYLIIYLYIKFFLRSVCQAASSDGEMDVNQDVHHIVYNDPHMKKKILAYLSRRHFKWRERCKTSHVHLLLYLYIKFIYHLSVREAATSNGEMDVNQDVHLIVYLYIKFNL